MTFVTLSLVHRVVASSHMCSPMNRRVSRRSPTMDRPITARIAVATAPITDDTTCAFNRSPLSVLRLGARRPYPCRRGGVVDGQRPRGGDVERPGRPGYRVALQHDGDPGASGDVHHRVGTVVLLNRHAGGDRRRGRV